MQNQTNLELKAISKKDYDKVYELNREVNNISGRILYKKEKDLKAV